MWEDLKLKEIRYLVTKADQCQMNWENHKNCGNSQNIGKSQKIGKDRKRGEINKIL